ncbi:hypothetical protein P3T39_006872 [Kitasatospora sp. GP82]|nr:hypothetical protein [Kitasatospora sp. GP82]
MAVNDTIVALTGANTPGGPIGTIADWTTEDSHPLPAGRQRIADAVLTAPADGVPVLLVEVDLHNGDNEKTARKFDGYAEYFALTYKDPNHEGHPSTAKQLPTWRRKYPTAPARVLPPIALVLAGAGPRALNNTINEVRDLTGKHWQPHRDFDFTGGGTGWLSLMGQDCCHLTPVATLVVTRIRLAAGCAVRGRGTV